MQPRKGGFRHLIIFTDGTWLWPGSDKTLDVYSNVYLLNTLLKDDDKNGCAQIVHYARGLGAVHGIRKYTAGGFAYGIEELVADLYINICSNYEAGDKLYLFGFSRGAVVARALTGLLSMGILEAKHINWFANVWGKYVGQGEVILPGQPRELSDLGAPIADFRSKCSELNPSIEFVGVFDTVVGGHGLAEVAQKLRLGDRKVPPNVRHAVQLLAIDETRSFFKPVFWTGTTDPAASESLEQIWMPGVHSDVGGACRDRNLGNLALLTMIDRVIAKTSLSFELNECRKLDVQPRFGTPIYINNEYTKWWRLFCPLPCARNVEDGLPQTVHPYAKFLRENLVSYKNERRNTFYSLPPEIEELRESPEFISDKFESNCCSRLRPRRFG